VYVLADSEILSSFDSFRSQLFSGRDTVRAVKKQPLRGSRRRGDMLSASSADAGTSGYSRSNLSEVVKSNIIYLLINVKIIIYIF
ncbi:MAG: hypothetical protein K2G11_00605, partial [Muribaculaceae bacterium]|nr:hypothetical protein [Muribaculaceae bacterium]